MKKKNQVSRFVCNECQYVTVKWLGKCPKCFAWNSFREAHAERILSLPSKADNPAQQASSVENLNFLRIPSGLSEFDRVVGGGLVSGSLTLLGGEPGIGKSTLLAMIMGSYSRRFENQKILYASGEESVTQVADRIARVTSKKDNLYLQSETSWQKILSELKRLKPKFFVLDSIQTTTSDEVDSVAGSASQIREVTYEVMNYIKANNIVTFIIGHITKEGSIAGPKILEHMVDAVLYFEGEDKSDHRILRAIKNRFGAINEIGIFEMTEKGLIEVLNPNSNVINDLNGGSFGHSLTAILEGNRTLLVETQALVVENKFGAARRVTQGLDQNRLTMLIAVIEKYLGLSLGSSDIYLNVAGGVRLLHREADLGIMASILSSFKASVINVDTVFLGEVGLTGEVRAVSKAEVRLKELSQLGYRKVVVCQKTALEFKGKFSLELQGISSPKELVEII